MIRRIFAAALLAMLTLSAHAATVYVEEYAIANYVLMQAASAPSLGHTTVAIGGSSVQSAAFLTTKTGLLLIRVVADSTCSIQIGTTNPTATATSARFAAGVPEYFVVNSGDKLAVITNN
jgi:hypothetical protein